MSFVPGMGIVKGMALTLRRFFEPKATIQYPEVAPDVAPRFRGRLQLLHDEWGTLKCETCFQCAQACPIECIDMGGVDTRGRYHVHWGPPEQYGERREESALRRSGRPVPDRSYTHIEPIDLAPLGPILDEYDHDPKNMLRILEAAQDVYGHLPVAALKEIAFSTGAWYALIYGTASFYRHLRFDSPAPTVEVCRCTSCLLAGGGRIARELESVLDTQIGQAAAPGAARLVALPAHPEGALPPVVAIDGEPQPEVTEANAAAWARALTGTAQA